MIDFNDVLQVLEVPLEVQMGKLGLEDIGRPEAKESHSEARDLHCPTEHVQHPHACRPHVRHLAQCDRRVGPVTLATVPGIQIRGVEEKSFV